MITPLANSTVSDQGCCSRRFGFIFRVFFFFFFSLQTELYWATAWGLHAWCSPLTAALRFEINQQLASTAFYEAVYTE